MVLLGSVRQRSHLGSPDRSHEHSASTSGSDDANPFSWRFTTPLFLGSALNPINSSLVAPALLPIARALEVPVGDTAGLVVALYLTSAIAQPTAGRIAVVIGARRVFLLGTVFLVIGGIMGGCADGLGMLTIGRVAIGLGTSCAYPTAMLLIRQRAISANLARPPGGVLGGLHISAMATACLGLPVGGLLVSSLGWRSVFLVNIPVGLVALGVTYAWIPVDRPQSRRLGLRTALGEFDLLGMTGFAAAMTSALLFLLSFPRPNWHLLALSIALWGALTVWETRTADPFFDVRLLVSNRHLTSTYARFGLVLLCLYMVLYGFTQWAESVRGLSETEAGLLLLPMTLVSGLTILPFSRRNLIRAPILVAAGACLAGSIGVSLLGRSTGIGWIVALTVMFGLAGGASAAGNQAAVYAQTSAGQLATASGLLRTFGYVGAMASSAAIAVAFHDQITDAGMHRVGVLMIVASLVLGANTVWASRRLSDSRRRPRHAGERAERP